MLELCDGLESAGGAGVTVEGGVEDKHRKPLQGFSLQKNKKQNIPAACEFSNKSQLTPSSH